MPPQGMKVKCSHCQQVGWIADPRYTSVCVHCGNVLPPNPKSLLRGPQPLLDPEIDDEPGVVVSVEDLVIGDEEKA